MLHDPFPSDPMPDYQVLGTAHWTPHWKDYMREPATVDIKNCSRAEAENARHNDSA